MLYIPTVSFLVFTLLSLVAPYSLLLYCTAVLAVRVSRIRTGTHRGLSAI